jgi:hypothetical protein
MERIRRVVTGVDESGKSIFVSDEELTGFTPPILGGARLFRLFGDDAPVPTIPTDGSEDLERRYFPPPGGYRYTVFTYPPAAEATAPVDLQAAIAESARMAPGLEDVVSSSDGFHYTPTIDLEYVIAGEFTLYLDDGVSKVLKAGDALVQCGAKHSWVNESDAPATMLLAFIGAEVDETRFA